MNQKAFTLIELLVVVAIIGILAAVGVVAYNGYTGAAKAAATKTIHKNVVKYISAEIAKCQFQETVMEGNLKCSGRTGQTIFDAVRKSLSHFKNPYGKGPNEPDDKAITDGGSYSDDHGVGYVRLQGASCSAANAASGCDNIGIGTCYAIPCYVSHTTPRKEQYIVTTLYVFE